MARLNHTTEEAHMSELEDLLHEHTVHDPPDDGPREQARRRVEKRRNLQTGFVAYVVVNAFLVAVWALTGGGYFWPAWVIGGWGVGMVLASWDYLRGPVTEADVDRELRR
jgi:hypothetical protein